MQLLARVAQRPIEDDVAIGQRPVTLGQLLLRLGQQRVFALELDGEKRKAYEFLRRLRITKNAVSLGGMESLACHPATTTHSEMTQEQQLSAGITQGLVRISVGIENWRDLLQEYTDALDAL